jgi:hypothetical protein
MQKQINQDAKEAQSGISGVRIAGMSAINAIVMLLLGAAVATLFSYIASH